MYVYYIYIYIQVVMKEKNVHKTTYIQSAPIIIE